MPELTLSKDEQAILIEVLTTSVSDLGAEIADTKLADYRSGLKDKKRAVMEILERLQKVSG